MSYLKRIESGCGSVHEVAKDADKEIERLKLANKELEEEYINYVKHMTDDITAANKEIEQLKKESEAAIKLLTAHICPDCNGDGAYHDNYGEPVQCQYCHEVSLLTTNRKV